MKKIIKILALCSVLLIGGMQNINAQTYFTITCTPCYDECTTLEDCIYRFSYTLIDVCANPDSTYCSGFIDVKCEDGPPYAVDIVCPDCEDATHNPCFFIGAGVQKTCIGPGGSHVICEGTKAEYHTCYELSSPGNVTVNVPWNN